MRCPIAVHSGPPDCVIRLLSLGHALAGMLLTGKSVILIYTCAEVCLTLLLTSELLQPSQVK